MHTQCMAIGLNLYLGSQSICFMGFWISYCGWSYAWQPEYTHVYSNPSLYLTESLSLLERLLFFLNVLPKIANPIFSFNPSIYSFR